MKETDKEKVRESLMCLYKVISMPIIKLWSGIS